VGEALMILVQGLSHWYQSPWEPQQGLQSFED
jgi:hypothetical protein